MKSRGKRTKANGNGGVGVYDMLAAPWTEAGKGGISQKVVRVDHAKGHYLGLVAFDQLVSSGLHQHLGVATSYVVQGSLSDYAGDILRGQMGINLKGATHDAVAYEKCLLVARLEGPVIYPPHDGPLHRLHAGARHSAIVNPAPEVMPDVNVTVDALPLSTTSLAGVSRRMIFDYKGTGDDRRLVQLQVLPGTRVPNHRTTALVEWFVLGGDISVGNHHASGGSFVCIEPESQVTLSSGYGALLLAWAEGPIEWSDGKPHPDLYGF
jgi:anti-sigma factor ChrR (cupin superfamily)